MPKNVESTENETWKNLKEMVLKSSERNMDSRKENKPRNGGSWVRSILAKMDKWRIWKNKNMLEGQVNYKRW